jgi:hypothetical protein
MFAEYYASYSVGIPVYGVLGNSERVLLHDKDADQKGRGWFSSHSAVASTYRLLSTTTPGKSVCKTTSFCTFQVVLADGVLMVATGGELPTLIFSFWSKVYGDHGAGPYAGRLG